MAQLPRATLSEKKFHKWLLPIVVMMIAVGIFSYLKSTRKVVQAQLPQERRWIVETMPITKQTHDTKLTALGVVSAGRTAVLRPDVTGKIVELAPDFRDGARLPAGTPLISIDPFDFETNLADAKAALIQAEERLQQLQSEQAGQQDQLAEAQESETLAAAEVKRQQALVKRGVATRRNLDDATRTLNAAAQSVAALKSAIRSLESQTIQQQRAIERAQLAMARAERDLIDTRITAPFDGFLTQPNAALGQQVSVNDTLGQLVASNELEIRFALSDADFAALGGPSGELLDKNVTIAWSPGPQTQYFDAQIKRQAAQAVAASGSIEMFAQLANPGLSLPLRPGMFVSVEIDETPLDDVIAVPVAALVDGVRLYAVQADDQAVKRLQLVDFDLLRRRDGRAFLRTDLAPGTQIVTRTFPQIMQGLKVDPRAAKAAAGENVQ